MTTQPTVRPSKDYIDNVLAQASQGKGVTRSSEFCVGYGIDDGISSSQFNPSTARRCGQRIGELKWMENAVPNDGQPYYFEIQNGRNDHSLFLAQVSFITPDGERHMRWMTNDEKYAKTHSRVFNVRSDETVSVSDYGMSDWGVDGLKVTRNYKGRSQRRF